MNSIQITGLFFNLIIYIIMILPLIIVSFNKKIYESKKKLFKVLIYCTIIEIFLSLILYIFPEKIFSLFTNTQGIINFAVYSSKIIFISSSLYAIKILIPAYLFRNSRKKTAILVLTKIAVNIFTIIILYNLFSTKGLLFSFPICDFIFYIIYLLNIIC